MEEPFRKEEWNLMEGITQEVTYRRKLIISLRGNWKKGFPRSFKN